MAKYYGQKEVKDIITDGDEKSVVIFTDDSQIVLANKMIAAAVTDEPKDLTTLRNLRCFPVVADILKVLHSWNVLVDEIDFIDSRVIISINESLKRANNVLWGKEEGERTIDEVNQVLTSEKENGTACIKSPFINK